MPNLNSIIAKISKDDIKEARHNAIKMYTGPNNPKPPLRMIAFDNAMTTK